MDVSDRPSSVMSEGQFSGRQLLDGCSNGNNGKFPVCGRSQPLKLRICLVGMLLRLLCETQEDGGMR